MSRRLDVAVFLFGLLVLACAPADSGGPSSGNAGASAGGAAGGGPAGAAGTAGRGGAAGTTAVGGAGAGGAGVAGVGGTGGAFGGSNAGGGGNGGSAASAGGTAGAAGTGTGGDAAGGGGASGSGGRGGAAGGGGSAGLGGAGGSSGKPQICLDLEAQWASALPRFLMCSAGQTCGNRVSAVPGCVCQIQVEEHAPLELETLLNVEGAWYDSDCDTWGPPAGCNMPCAPANRGACQNGRCVGLP